MELLIYTVLGLTLTWALYLAYMHIATRAAEGRSAAPLIERIPALGAADGRALVYCFSPQCAPCRPMSRDVDSLAASGAPVFKLDINDHPDLCHELGIRATPTLILVEGGAIARMMIGVKTANYMLALLARG